MRTEPVLALTGRFGVPRRALARGFVFEHETLAQAVALTPS